MTEPWMKAVWQWKENLPEKAASKRSVEIGRGGFFGRLRKGTGGGMGVPSGFPRGELQNVVVIGLFRVCHGADLLGQGQAALCEFRFFS